ncbi:transcriptional regulator opi1, partial [Coemansia sp. RSA 2607]
MVEAAETLGALRRPSGGDSHGVQFIQRVQAIPLVNSAIGMYDRTRQSSRLVRVGSNVIESGVRRMCEPITKRIDVAQLDSFACRQLDNLGYTSERQQAEQPGQAGQAATGSSSNLRKRTKDQAQADDMDVMDDVDSSNGKNKYYDGRNELEAPLLPPRPQQLRQQQQQQQQQQQATNGKWRVANLVATARERALAVREDSMRRLKYCLDWVAYATALVGQHMHALRQLLNALQQASRTAFYSHGGSGAAEPAVVRADEADGGAAVRRIHEAGVELARARREIVAAVRRAVGVVSHYAGSVLPGEARRQVRALV